MPRSDGAMYSPRPAALPRRSNNSTRNHESTPVIALATPSPETTDVSTLAVDAAMSIVCGSPTAVYAPSCVSKCTVNVYLPASVGVYSPWK